MLIRRIDMEKIVYTPEKDGFYGVWYPAPSGSDRGMILMLGDSSDDMLARTGARWVHRFGISAMAMSPAKKDYGHHNYPLERFGRAIDVMHKYGCKKIGIVGASTTGMLALIAASYYPELSLTVAISPSDFVMEGFYRDGKDGMEERPGDGESTVTWQGEPLPYLPYAYRHPEYWLKIKEESKRTGNLVSSRGMFDESERRHPLQESEKIKVENIRGKIVFIGAEDDVLWDTCRYIKRMQKRLSERQHDDCTAEAWLYTHGTHFAFPESMLKMMLPVGISLMVGLFFKDARKYGRQCRQTRKDIDMRLSRTLREWGTA